MSGYIEKLTDLGRDIKNGEVSAADAEAISNYDHTEVINGKEVPYVLSWVDAPEITISAQSNSDGSMMLTDYEGGKLITLRQTQGKPKAREI